MHSIHDKMNTGIGFGKVVFCGGFVVLENEPAIVWCVENAKIESNVKFGGNSIIIASDFDEQKYEYDLNANRISGDKNLFIDQFISDLPILRGCSIKIKTDDLFSNGQGKTGLGSSSALITSLSKAFSLDLSFAFYAHFKAGGNSGSGIDIYASYLGSLLFNNRNSFKPLPNFENWKYFLITAKNMKGSNTREKIKIWNSIDAEQKKKLIVANQNLCNEYLAQKISKSTVKAYREAQRSFSDLGLLIEPREWTEILDFFNQQPNVVAALCPGSGGYDSAVMITNGEISFHEFCEIRELKIKTI